MQQNVSVENVQPGRRVFAYYGKILGGAHSQQTTTAVNSELCEVYFVCISVHMYHSMIQQ